MIKQTLAIALAATAVAVLPLTGWFETDEVAHGLTADVTRGPITVWTSFEGKLESRRVVMVMSRSKGNATLMEIAPEGQRVAAGDVIARLDVAELERRMVKLEEEHKLALSELDTLVSAEHPMELRDLEGQVEEARLDLDAERSYLADSEKLAADDLVSDAEVTKQQRKVSALTRRAEALDSKLELTRDIIHPAALERARTRLAAADAALAIARDEIASAVIRAPGDGVVVHKPLHVGGEFRTARAGDTVYPNQPFMVLPDMNDLVVESLIPEADLGRAQAGAESLVRPLAFPETGLAATVERVGTMAQTAPGQPSWQRFFPVTLGLGQPDPRLRPGMTVTVQVVVEHRPDVLRVSRRAVEWQQDQAYARVRNGETVERRRIVVGVADDSHFEVLEGLRAGEAVLLE